MFDVDDLIERCRAALAEPEPRLAVRDALAGAVARPSDVESALPLHRAEIERLHAAAELTVIKVVWAPGMTIPPHDHRMWAAIGIYAGQEDNALYRRSGTSIEQSGGRRLEEGDVVLLGDDAIHSVTNPRAGLTGAIHVYGGDFFGVARSEWPPPDFVERPHDGLAAARYFEAAEAARTDRPAG